MGKRADKQAGRKAAAAALQGKPWQVRLAAKVGEFVKPKRPPMEMDDDLQEPNKIHGKEWKRVAKIGQGSYGSVYIGQRVEDGMVFAVKSTYMAWVPGKYSVMEPVLALRNEIITLSQIRCKYIVRMLGCGQSDSSNLLTDDIYYGSTPMLDLFLEYIPRGSLHHLMKRLEMGSTMVGTDPAHKQPIGRASKSSEHASLSSSQNRNKRLPEDYVRAYTEDILRAVDYLHRKQFVHGDIKPLNLLVAEDCLKLADFGGCKTLKKKRLTTFQINTQAYSAPEVFYGVQQGFASDVFSVGCTVLEMVSGSVPDPLFIPQWLSPDGQNFLWRCLTSDPYKRWTAAQLLEHPFIRDRDRNDNRPYSTVIPGGAERMILQPPPVEAYTNTMLSPTYTGKYPRVDPVDPITMTLKIYGNPTKFRKERINISSEPAPKINDSDESVIDVRLSPSAGANIVPPAVGAVANIGTAAETGSWPQTKGKAPAMTSSSSLPGVPQASKPAAKNGPPIAAADTRAAAQRAKPTLQDQFVKEPARQLKVNSRPELGYRTDPDDIDSSSTTASSSTNKGDDSHHRPKSPEFQALLPDYEPEFVPPRNHSLHFLLPLVASKEGNNKYADLDARAAALLQEKRREMQRKPPPLVMADSHSGSQYNHVIPQHMAQPTVRQLQQLFKTYRSIRECNEEIREEAQIAEEAGIYVNKLCPLSDEGNSKSVKSPTRKGRSNNPTVITGFRPLLNTIVSALLGSFSCKQADTHIALNSSAARPEYYPSSGPGSPVNLGEWGRLLPNARRTYWGS
ncbi:unnamed protein product [Calypogeia fissa]